MQEKKRPSDVRPHEGDGRSAPYPVSRMAPAIELVDLARELAEADQRVTQMAHGKLKVLAEQMRALQAEARRVLEQARESQALHRAECNFVRQPGKVYHLYRRDNGRCYFSLLSPEEWGGQPPHPYEGAYRLEADLSWTPAGEEAPDEAGEAARRLLLEGGLQGLED